jgi:hypothetical protein
MKLYYILFSDAINKILTVEKSKDMWKFYVMISISFAMGFNLFMLSFILHDLNILKIETIEVRLNATGIYQLDSFLSYAVVYLFPFLMINYFLVFYKDKYKEIIIKYRNYNGKLFTWYFVISLMAFSFVFHCRSY